MSIVWPESWHDGELKKVCDRIARERDLNFLLLPKNLTYLEWVTEGNISSSLTGPVAVLLAPGPFRPKDVLTWRQELSQRRMRGVICRPNRLHFFDAERSEAAQPLILPGLHIPEHVSRSPTARSGPIQTAMMQCTDIRL